MEQRIAAIQKHVTQEQHSTLVRHVRVRAAYHGESYGFAYAEVFRCVQRVMRI
jgi:hypothetical protein